MVAREVRPIPNHTRMRGAKAILGTIWTVTSSGVIARRSRSDDTMSTAPAVPRTTAARKPSAMPSTVAITCPAQLGPKATSRAITCPMPGRMKGGGRRSHTEPCQSASTAAKASVGATAPPSRSRIYLTALWAAPTNRFV